MANIKIEKKNSFRIEYTKGDTYALKLTFKNVDQDLTSAFFTVKENHEDATPLIEKTIGAGITKLDENFYKRELVYKLQLQATDSQFLEADHLYLYDLKIAVGNVIKTVIKGNFVVTYNVTGVDRITTELAEIEIDDAIDTDAETTPATHGIEYETDPVATAQIGNMQTLSTTAKSTLVEAINEIEPKATTALEEVTKIEDGTVTVPSATHATSADSAINAENATNALNSTNATNSTNAQKINNLELARDENGILKIGDTIIPQKELLWSGEYQTANNDPFVFSSNKLSAGDMVEIEWGYNNNIVRSKAIIPNDVNSFLTFTFHFIYGGSTSLYTLALNAIYSALNTLSIYRLMENGNSTTYFTGYPKIYKVYKIIE